MTQQQSINGLEPELRDMLAEQDAVYVRQHKRRLPGEIQNDDAVFGSARYWRVRAERAEATVALAHRILDWALTFMGACPSCGSKDGRQHRCLATGIYINGAHEMLGELNQAMREFSDDLAAIVNRWGR